MNNNAPLDGTLLCAAREIVFNAPRNEFAEALGVTPQKLAAWEHGREPITPHIQELFLRMLFDTPPTTGIADQIEREIAQSLQSESDALFTGMSDDSHILFFFNGCSVLYDPSDNTLERAWYMEQITEQYMSGIILLQSINPYDWDWREFKEAAALHGVSLDDDFDEFDAEDKAALVKSSEHLSAWVSERSKIAIQSIDHLDSLQDILNRYESNLTEVEVLDEGAPSNYLFC